ncbi:saccharopine dehydrogenase family protein [Salinibacter altiplanensis]|uniref:saccharopine dehydrogenase family protein n=1 Tax=Salinibacter altiplanensis TaxID=1803181 RepID=UPI000C9F3A44|nr:saccharopine dehydrogenase NADP-binding domain-containing protein [Salinibacter altiplanensis]
MAHATAHHDTAHEDTSPFDVVLWGATGFVGRLVAEYFAEHYSRSDTSQGKISWAIAGRNRAKLESLRRDLKDQFSLSEDLSILVGDALDPESLDSIARQSRVVCTTVGPYAKYGTNLVEACVAHGTDYCDLTGEVAWVRDIIDRYHEEAREAGARLVHCCGFDSMPSDLGTLMIQEESRKIHGRPCENVRLLVTDAQGGFSGGTLASLFGTLERASRDDRVRSILADPYALNPPGTRSGPNEGSQDEGLQDEGLQDEGFQWGARYDQTVGAWTGPFLMAPVNEKVVRRSNALMGDLMEDRHGGDGYGPAFRYAESTQFGPGLSGAVKAYGTALLSATLVGVVATPPLRRLLETLALPDPGEGPSREAIESGYFDISLYGWGRDDSGTRFGVRGTVAADRDPGYGATAIMLAESALCLASGEANSALQGGCLTPASGMGMPLTQRLQDAGLTFDAEAFDLRG